MLSTGGGGLEGRGGGGLFGRGGGGLAGGEGGGCWLAGGEGGDGYTLREIWSLKSIYRINKRCLIFMLVLQRTVYC